MANIRAYADLVIQKKRDVSTNNKQLYFHDMLHQARNWSTSTLLTNHENR
jgi:hypothetical protein